MIAGSRENSQQRCTLENGQLRLSRMQDPVTSKVGQARPYGLARAKNLSLPTAQSVGVSKKIQRSSSIDHRLANTYHRRQRLINSFALRSTFEGSNTIVIDHSSA